MPWETGNARDLLYRDVRLCAVAWSLRGCPCVDMACVSLQGFTGRRGCGQGWTGGGWLNQACSSSFRLRSTWGCPHLVPRARPLGLGPRKLSRLQVTPLLGSDIAPGCPEPCEPQAAFLPLRMTVTSVLIRQAPLVWTQGLGDQVLAGLRALLPQGPQSSQ